MSVSVWRTGAAACVLALGAGAPAAAQQAAEAGGEHATETLLLASSCANCHGTEGQGAVPMLPLAGRPYETLREQLLDFQRGEAPVSTVMGRIVGAYTEDEIEALARYFSSLPAGGGEQ